MDPDSYKDKSPVAFDKEFDSVVPGGWKNPCGSTAGEGERRRKKKKKGAALYSTVLRLTACLPAVLPLPVSVSLLSLL